MPKKYIPVAQRTSQSTAEVSTPGNIQAGNGGTVTCPVETAEFLLANAQSYRTQLDHAIQNMQSSLRQGINWSGGNVPAQTAGTMPAGRQPMPLSQRKKIAAAARARAQAKKQQATGESEEAPPRKRRAKTAAATA